MARTQSRNRTPREHLARVRQDGRLLPRAEHTAATSMSLEDRLLVAFARRWAPFGGPPRGEALVEFGLTSYQFARRLQAIVTGPHVDELHPTDVRTIRRTYLRETLSGTE